MKPFVLTVLCTSLSCTLARGDSGTPAAPEPFQLGLNASLSSSISGQTKLKVGRHASGEVSSTDFDHSASYEIALPNGAALTVGHNLHGTYFDLPEHNSTVALPDRLQSAQMDLSYMQTCNDQWSALVAVSPGLRWTGSKIESDAFGVSGAAGAIYRRSATLSLMFGVGFDSMAHHKVLPGGGLQWTPSERWSVSLGYPRTAVTYRANEALSLSLVAEGIADTYHVEKDPLPGLVGKPSLANTKLEYNDYRVGLAAEYRATPHCTVTATVGCVVAREFDYFERHYRLKSDGTAAYGSLAVALKY
jgi:hypothetical protein